MKAPFYDMLGNPIDVGDLFVIPDGNARYGGLKIYIGLVLSRTEKTMTTEVFELPSGKPKGTKRKTPSKVLKIDPNFYTDYSNFILELQQKANRIKVNT
jgi:hypothetical protein